MNTTNEIWYDWSQAPEWANWAVINENGTAYWCSNKPHRIIEGQLMYAVQERADFLKLNQYSFPPKTDWRETARERPKAEKKDEQWPWTEEEKSAFKYQCFKGSPLECNGQTSLLFDKAAEFGALKEREAIAPMLKTIALCMTEDGGYRGDIMAILEQRLNVWDKSVPTFDPFKKC